MAPEEQEIRNQIIKEAMRLYYSSYDGPFMGKIIEPLYKAMIALDKIRTDKENE